MKDGSQGRTTVKNWNNVQLPPGIRIPGLFFFAKFCCRIMKSNSALIREEINMCLYFIVFTLIGIAMGWQLTRLYDTIKEVKEMESED